MKNRFAIISCYALTLALLIPFTIIAGQHQALTPADYGKWETLTFASLSPDGKWIAYGINRANGANEMRVRSLSESNTQATAFGSEPAFSDDSRWLACAIGYSEQEQERLARAKRPAHRKLALFNLSNRQSQTIDGVAAFAFSPGGAYLAMQRYPAEKKDPAPTESAESQADKDAPGADLVVRDLVKGTDINFGNVSSFMWQDKGALLALTINADGRAGNGVNLYDPQTGILRVLDSGSASFTGLAWRKDDDDLVVLRSKKNEAYEEETFTVLVWRDLASQQPVKKEFDHTASASFPVNTRVVKYRKPVWAESGSTIFIGVKNWTKKSAPQNNSTVKPGDKSDDQDTEEPAGVEVWHARDKEIIPEQKLRAERDRQKNYLAAWHIDSGRFIQLADDAIEDVTLLKGGKHAIALEEKPYEREEMFGRPYANLYLIDIETGQRSRIADKVMYPMGGSPGGRYALYFKDDNYWTYDIANKKQTNITRAITTSVANREDDHPVEQRFPYGMAGWTKDDASIIVYDRYDMWEARADGSKVSKITNGAAEEIRHQYVKLDPKEEFINTAQPLYLSLYSEWSKRSGYGRLRAGAQTERLVWLDKNVGRLTKAKSSDVYVYSVMAFDDSPDLFVGGPNLADARQVTETNPFQKDYGWGKSELIEYKNSRGERLQGALYYPANYEAGKQYPMIVYIYEKLSQNLHVYYSPSERSPYNPSVFTSRGYFVLQPDIVFRERDPGLSIVDAVTAAVNKVLEKGSIDRNRLGLVGHSWGGYGTAFTATQTDMFKAAVAGAALTDLVSMYGSVFWNSGRPETDHFEVGQERMQVPLWEDREAYLRNSPVFSVHKMKTSLLMAFGDNDGSVDWKQGIEMYNIARRAGKDFVLLVYPGENHGLRKRANQIDYHRRIIEWFGHHLQGAPAPAWMTKGTSYLEREQELKRLRESKAAKKTPANPTPQ